MGVPLAVPELFTSRQSPAGGMISPLGRSFPRAALGPAPAPRWTCDPAGASRAETVPPAPKLHVCAALPLQSSISMAVPSTERPPATWRHLLAHELTIGPAGSVVERAAEVSAVRSASRTESGESAQAAIATSE